MKRARLCRIVMAMIALVGTAGSGHAQTTFTNWQSSHAAPTGQFTDVTMVNGTRVFAGFEVDSVTLALNATIYQTSGDPGSTAVTQMDLGLTTYESAAISVAGADTGSAWWAAANQLLPTFEALSFIFSSTDIQNPVPMVGPAPGSSPDVEIHAINHKGVAVGTVDLTTPLVYSSVTGVTTTFPYPYDAVLYAVSSSGDRIAGSAAASAGGDPVATIFDCCGNVIYQDTVPGIIWDVEGAFAVGERNGNAAYWKKIGGTWRITMLESAPGSPIAGALLAVDHRGYGLAGGVREVGSPIVIDLLTGTWLQFENRLPVAPGTFYRVVGVDVDPQTFQAALAVEGADFTGWDVTMNVVARPLGPTLPGPGFWVAPALLLAAIPVGMRRFRT